MLIDLDKKPYKMNLFYRKLGKGKPLFILHGLFGSCDNWQSLGKRYAENFEVYLIDQRNHGQSFHSPDWNYDFMATDIKSICNQNGLNQISLLGHSMGGKAAMTFALNYPEMVEHLIVVDISPAYYPIHHRTILDSLLHLDLTLVKSRKEAESELSKSIKNIAELQFLLKNLYWKDLENQLLAWRFNLKVINENIEEVGKAQEGIAYTKPTLFIKGEQSNYILDSHLNQMKSLFPKSDIVTIPSAGHWVQAEQPDAFFKACADFLQIR